MTGLVRSVIVSVSISPSLMVTDYSFEVISAEDSVALKEELMTKLLKDYEQEIAMKAQEEAKINSKAKAALKNHERLLYKPSQTQYYSSMCATFSFRHTHSYVLSYYTGDKEMLESEFQKWHDRQVKREDALKEVENRVYIEYR